MLLRIAEGADGKEFKYLTPFDAPGNEVSKYLHRFEPKSYARMQTKESLTSDIAATC